MTFELKLASDFPQINAGMWPQEQTWEFVGPSRPPGPRLHLFAGTFLPLFSLGIAFHRPRDNDPSPPACNNAVVLQPADPLRVPGRRLPGRDGVPLPGLHRRAPGAVPEAHRDLRRDRARAWLRVLPRVRPARGRGVRRVHPEVRHRAALLPDARLGASPGATGAGPGAVPAQSGHGHGHLQPGAPGANQWSVSLQGLRLPRDPFLTSLSRRQRDD